MGRAEGMKYDIFISYRRDGGDIMAHMLYEQLTKKGFTVFQDIETLRSGKFNTSIYEKIEQCKDVIVVLPPNCLEGCQDNDDWVRKEIACAINNKKNIIPVMLRGFEWPKILPKDIDEIRYYNGIVVNVEYFEQFLNKLEGFLNSSPCYKIIFKEKHIVRMLLLGSLIVFSLILPWIIMYVFHMCFGLLWRIIYFAIILILMAIVLNLIETKPEVARRCFSSLTEEDLRKHPDIVYNKLISDFGKNIFVSKEKYEPFLSLYVLKKLAFGTWDGERTNYVKIYFRRKFEWYDPSIFYLHTLSKGSDAVKMLIRQGFLLQTTPAFIDLDADYLVKERFHIFLFYRKNRLDYMNIFQCSSEELKEKYEETYRVIKDEEILGR